MNLGAGALLVITGILFVALVHCDVKCCTEILATIAHVLAFSVVLVHNAYMSVLVFQNGRWAASVSGSLVECDIVYYQEIAIYVICLWVGIVVLPLLCSLIVHCCCGCAVDDMREEDVAKGRRCCATQRREPEGAPLTVGGQANMETASGVAPKRD